MSIRFDEDFLRRLEPLKLAVRRRVRGRREGERTTARRGGAGEFLSHRGYVQGDDFRNIDWNLYARLGALFLREHARDEAPVFHILLDTSASMAFGKIDFAARLAAALGVIAHGEFAEVRLQGEKAPGTLPQLLEELGSVRAEGPCGFAEQVPRMRGAGSPVFILSDLWEDSLRDPILRAAEHGHAALLHVLSPEELSPGFEGRFRMVDSESGETCLRFVGDEERTKYRALLEEHCASWRNWAARHEISYLPCRSDVPVEEIVLVLMRETGIVE